MIHCFRWEETLSAWNHCAADILAAAVGADVVAAAAAAAAAIVVVASAELPASSGSILSHCPDSGLAPLRKKPVVPVPS